MPSDPTAVVSASESVVTYTVNGTVYSPTSAGVGGLAVEIVDKNAGPDVALANATTNGDGTYTVSFTILPASLREHNKTMPDLQARVSAGKTFLAASDVRYNAPTSVTLDVTIPAGTAGLATEYEALTQSLAATYTGKLGALEEDGTRTDN